MEGGGGVGLGFASVSTTLIRRVPPCWLFFCEAYFLVYSFKDIELNSKS